MLWCHYLQALACFNAISFWHYGSQVLCTNTLTGLSLIWYMNECKFDLERKKGSHINAITLNFKAPEYKRKAHQREYIFLSYQQPKCLHVSRFVSSIIVLIGPNIRNTLDVAAKHLNVKTDKRWTTNMIMEMVTAAQKLNGRKDLDQKNSTAFSICSVNTPQNYKIHKVPVSNCCPWKDTLLQNNSLLVVYI